MNQTKINDLYSYSFLGNLKVHGNKAVFVKAMANEATDSYNQVLYMAEKDQVRQLTSFGSETSFVFKNENTIAFCSNRKKVKGKTFLYELSLNGGEALPVLSIDKENAQLIGYLSNGAIIFSVTEDEQENESDYEVFDEIPFYINGQGITNKKRNHLYLWQNNTLSALTDPLFDAAMVKLYKDELYVVGENWTRKSSLMPAMYRIDPLKNEWELCIEKETVSIFDFAPYEKGVYVFASDCKRFGLNQNPDLYILEGNNLKKIGDWGFCIGNTVGSDCAVVAGNTMLVHEGNLYFTTTVKDHVELFRYTDSFERVFAMDGTIQAFGYRKDELLLIGAEKAKLQELYCVKDNTLQCLSSFNHLQTFVSVPQPISYKGYDGSDMLGYIMYPKDFDSGKQYPGILDIHGGPKTVYGTVFYHEMQVWASEGYFVFYCNPHGSDGASNEFADIRGKYGTIDYEDIMNFVDEVITSVPQLDPKKIGVTGGSYGGFMTNWIIGHTNRFAAAASQRSISNWISFSQTSDIGPYFTQDQQAANMDENIEKLWFHSPIRYAKNVETPTLFIHSDEDYRCPLSEGIQMLNALLDRNIEARMCVFHQENHDLSRTGKPKHRIRRLNEITNWMNTHLKDEKKD